MTHDPGRFDSAVTRRAALRTLGLATLGAACPAAAAAAPRPAATVASPAGRDVSAPAREDFELAEVLRLASVPSFTLARVQGTRITTQAVGAQRNGESVPVAADTVYAAASLTKAVFAYTFLSFVQDGLVSLDRPVRDYLALPNPDDPRGGAITARHLLSHTSGWRNWRNSATTPLVADFEPGARWSYAGEGFFFLQRVLGTLTGRSTSTLLRERVFTPLGMTRSSLAPLAELDVNRAVGHDGRGTPQTPFGRATMLELRRAMSEAGRSLETVGASQCAWQWGDNPGYKSYFWADPEREQAMVVFTNGDRGARVYERVIRSVTGDDRAGFLWA